MAGTTQYNVGIHISAVNNITPVLNQIANQLSGLKNHTITLTGHFNGLRTAIHGASAAGAGFGLFRGMERTVEAAKALSHELVQVKKLGVTDAQFEAVKAESQRVPGAVPGASETSALKAYSSMYSMFGHDGALKMMEGVSRFAGVLGNTTHDYKGAADRVYELVRAGDLMGKFVDESTHKVDPEKLRGFLDLASKLTLVTHGKVDPKTWLGLAQQGGPALGGMSENGLMTMGIIAQAMGGQRAGTALSSLYQQFVGGKTTQPVAEEMKKLGMISGYSVLKGGHVSISEEQKNQEYKSALKTDMVDFTKKLVEDWKKAGKGMDEMVESLYTLFGRTTTQRLIHDMLRNLPQIEGERDRAKQAMGVEPSAALQNKEDYSQILNNMTTAWDRFMAAIGNSKGALDIMAFVTNALNTATDWANKHPESVKIFGEAIMGAAAALGILGGAAMLAAVAAFAPGGAIAVGVAAVVGAVGMLAALNIDGVKAVLTGILDAIRGFIDGIKSLPAKIDGWLKSQVPYDLERKGGPGVERYGVPWKKSSLDEPAFGPPRKQAMLQPIHVHTAHNVDGHTWAQSTSIHLAKLFEHPTSAPAYDRSRGFMSPDDNFQTG